MKQNVKLLVVITLIVISGKYNPTFSQSTIQGNGLSGAVPNPNEYLGSSNGYNVEFKAAGTLRMKMLQSNGYLGIGIASPIHRLDVDSGNINVHKIDSGYMINNHFVLWHNGDSSNIFIGVAAGDSSFGGANVFAGFHAGKYATVSSNVAIGHLAGSDTGFVGSENVFIGQAAGNADSSGQDNVFIGHGAGEKHHQGDYNTFLGEGAGTNDSLGEYNTFVGHCGNSNTTASSNVGVGHHALKVQTYSNSNVEWSSYNVAIGCSTLLNNNPTDTLNGIYNTALGHDAGKNNVTGLKNIFIGAGANCGSGALINSTAIGFNAIVKDSNEMILGGIDTSTNSPVKVGIGLSGLNTGPRNFLEINANPFSNSYSGADLSGLTFRQLNATATTNFLTPWGNVLTVDSLGKVVLTQDVSAGAPACRNATKFTGGFVEWGGSGANDALIHNTEIQMVDPNTSGEYNIYFTGQSTVGGNTTPVDIGIGYAMSSSLLAKLDVINETHSVSGETTYSFTNQYAGRFYQTGDYDNSIASGTDDMIGVYGESDVSEVAADPISNRNNIGGDFYASNAKTNIGARGTAVGNSYGFNIGLNGIASGTTNNYGLWAEVNPPTANAVNVGAYGRIDLTSIPSNSNNYAVFGDLVSPPSNGSDWAGYFNGDVFSTTNVYAGSDAGLKQNIQAIENPMNVISQLQPKSYTFNQQANSSMNLPVGTRYGLLAQDLYNVLPQLTKDCVHPARYDSQGNQTHAPIDFKAINYTELIPFLIAGLKQIDSTNQELQNQVNALSALVENCCDNSSGQLHQNPNGNNSNGNNNTGNNIDVVLASRGIVLNQNDPNPFKEETVIEYFIPDDASNVKIIFTDSKGSVLKEVAIPEKGKGQLNVYASDLSSGIYSYTLVADGITIETKKMMKTK